ncbi:hypothetical protein GCM10009834_29470 [Streptomonospora arabica]
MSRRSSATWTASVASAVSAGAEVVSYTAVLTIPAQPLRAARRFLDAAWDRADPRAPPVKAEPRRGGVAGIGWSGAGPDRWPAALARARAASASHRQGWCRAAADPGVPGGPCARRGQGRQ